MPLDTLTDLFASRGLELTPQEVVAHKEGWLLAWVCEAWASWDPSDSCRYLLVYRSPLVKDTKPMYQPVSDLLLGSERMDLLSKGLHDDPKMMLGRGEHLLVRLCAADFKPKFTVEQIRQAIHTAISEGVS